jgi:hypothetical protein
MSDPNWKNLKPQKLEKLISKKMKNQNWYEMSFGAGS